MRSALRDNVELTMMKMAQKRLWSARELFNQAMKAYQEPQDQAYRGFPWLQIMLEFSTTHGIQRSAPASSPAQPAFSSCSSSIVPYGVIYWS
jgi:hypothetical protein